MEFILIFFFSVVVPLLMTGLVGYKKAYLPFKDGKLKIDKLKNPTLYRIQRHLYVSNTEQREIEAIEKRKAIDWRRTVEAKSITAHSAELIEVKRDKHNKELWKFDTEFQEITRERDEQARREAEAKAYEIRKREEAVRTQLREKELAIWTANEKARIERFKAEQAALQAERDRQATDLLRSRENDIQALRKYYVPDHKNQRFGYRIVNVHGLYVRKLPVKASRMLDNLTNGSMLSVNGWIVGDELYGNPIWFKLANDLGWVWSGGVDNKSTSGLVNYNYMNEPGESFACKSAGGTIVSEYTTPSEMKTLIDTEIKALEAERNDLEALKTSSSNSTALVSIIRDDGNWRRL